MIYAVAFILFFMYLAGLAFVMWQVKKAPHGHEDEKGFHVTPKDPKQ